MGANLKGSDGLSDVQRTVLRAWQAGALTIKDIAARTGVTKSQADHALARLRILGRLPQPIEAAPPPPAPAVDPAAPFYAGPRSQALGILAVRVVRFVPVGQAAGGSAEPREIWVSLPFVAALNPGSPHA